MTKGRRRKWWEGESGGEAVEGEEMVNIVEKGGHT